MKPVLRYQLVLSCDRQPGICDRIRKTNGGDWRLLSYSGTQKVPECRVGEPHHSLDSDDPRATSVTNIPGENFHEREG
jgi:hypothetical protein